MDILDTLMDDMGLTDPVPATPEDGLYMEWTSGKMPKIYNCQYWLKQELYVYRHLQDKMYIVSKPNGLTRLQISTKELARGLLEYYFLMVAHTKFHGERAGERGMLVDMERFLDLVLEQETIKKLIDNPANLI